MNQQPNYLLAFLLLATFTSSVGLCIFLLFIFAGG